MSNPGAKKQSLSQHGARTLASEAIPSVFKVQIKGATLKDSGPTRKIYEWFSAPKLGGAQNHDARDKSLHKE
jgi:hypothetical protein